MPNEQNLPKANRLLFPGEHCSWKELRTRCRNPRNPAFKHYGGRGIQVCARWKSFALFLEDMGKRPSPEHTIERIDHNGNYEPGNCRWATMKEQARNRRNNTFLSFKGETKCISEWAESMGVSSDLLYGRLKLGFPIWKVLTNRNLASKNSNKPLLKYVTRSEWERNKKAKASTQTQIL